MALKQEEGEKTESEVSSKENSNDNKQSWSRRKFLKTFGTTAGGATVFVIGLSKGGDELFVPRAAVSKQQVLGTLPELINATTAGTVNNVDAVIAYDYLGQSGTISVERDFTGAITQLIYGPLTVSVMRNADGSVSSVTSAIPSDTINSTDSINRDSEGNIISIVRTTTTT